MDQGEENMKKWKCTVCGYIHVGEEPPEECPVCGADRSKFEELVEAPPAEQETVKTPAKDDGLFGKAVQLILDRHLHPISVHTPNGIFPAAVLFLLLGVALKMSSFELAAFYNMVFVLFAMPVVLFTGYVEWQKRYKGAKTSLFFTKITCGVVVLVSLAVLVVWRIIDPHVADPVSSTRWIYFLLHLAPLTAVGLAGNLGGKLVFGKKK